MLIDATAQQYAPDKRTDLFQVEPSGSTLRGETTRPQAKASLLRRLDSAGLFYIDSITVLPTAELQGRSNGVITISVANLRTQPHHRAELATQAVMGTMLRVWKKQRGWYLVQTPDEYMAWIDGGAFAPMDSAEAINWGGRPKYIFTSPFGFLFSDTNTTKSVSDLVYGGMMAVLDSTRNFMRVSLPDGRSGYVPKTNGMHLADWQRSHRPTPAAIVDAASKLMGVPYLWGGTSFKGVDCSGFTKTAYLMNGLQLPRDASQQAGLGIEIETSNGWGLLQPGDLLFFGNTNGHQPPLVTHVGIWIGNGEFIHASGMVQVASLVPGAPNYDASEHKRFLKAKRILGDPRIINLAK